MKVRLTLVMVPNEPKELKPGMLCRSISDDAEPYRFYFLTEDIIPSDNNSFHQSLIPFIVSKDEAKELEEGKLYLFNFGDGGCCVGYENEICDKSDILNFFEVKVEPENIGLVMSLNGNRDIDVEDFNAIMAKDGWCYVEMEDEFTNPEKFTNVGWGDSIPQLKLYDGKCLINY